MMEARKTGSRGGHQVPRRPPGAAPTRGAPGGRLYSWGHPGSSLWPIYPSSSENPKKRGVSRVPTPLHGGNLQSRKGISGGHIPPGRTPPGRGDHHHHHHYRHEHHRHHHQHHTQHQHHLHHH